jgi:hypothetical protein
VSLDSGGNVSTEMTYRRTKCVTMGPVRFRFRHLHDLHLSPSSNLVPRVTCSDIRMHPFGGSPRCPRSVACLSIITRPHKRGQPQERIVDVYRLWVLKLPDARRPSTRPNRYESYQFEIIMLSIIGLGVQGHGPRTEGAFAVSTKCGKWLMFSSVVSQGIYGFTRAGKLR